MGKLCYVKENNKTACGTDADALKISYCPSLKYLEAAWQQPVSSLEYRHHIRFVGICIALLKIKYILIDFTKFGNPTLVDQKSTSDFLQKALLNTTLVRSARVLSGDEQQFRVHKSIEEEGIKLPYQVKVFYSTEEGKKWLLPQQSENICSRDSIWIPVDCNHKILRSLAASEVTATAEVQDEAKEEATNTTVCRTDFMEIVIDLNKKLLVLRWLRIASSREYRYGILKAVRALLENKIELLLINNHRRGILTLADQTWFVSNSVAVLSKSNLQKLAIINSADAIQQMTSEAIDARMKKANLAFSSQLFLSEAEATGWLLTTDNE